ncbi:MAG: dephospho-CoA kinase [Bacteroidetes bacterium]|nr:dephospho-CoA kinase [Bacteroidota bacterium]
MRSFNEPVRVGITGGIASGKSLAAAWFERSGFPVFYADLVAKSIPETNAEVRSALIGYFGEQAFLPDNRLNRPFLASAIFGSEENRLWMNQLIHPLVLQAFKTFCNEHDTAEMIIHEAALIYQSGFDKHLDFVIFISASEELRINRALSRGMDSPEAVRQRIMAQGDLTVFEKKADFLLFNTGTPEELEAKLETTLRAIRSHH